ncbi:MAG: hypothetical protein NDJ19_00690 [Ramlibacter sp.]|nr:hypothetical protein [Ramlibacter sp.]
MIELLPWLNLLLLPTLGYVIRMEHRLTRLEALREADRDARADGSHVHRRRTDPQP